MIGLIDSGMGGLTTLAALVERGCDHRFCYLADTRHAPYGERDSLSLIALGERWAKRLVGLGADAIVLGCNTLTMAALDYLQATTSVPVYGVRPPVVEGAMLLGTSYTCRKLGRGVALPRLATLIDAHYPDLPPIRAYLEGQLEGKSADTVVLGCTHYALVKDEISRVLHAKTVVDPSVWLARKLPRATGGQGVGVDLILTGDGDQGRYIETLKTLLGKEPNIV
ncbi:MAG: aspartate/glutamate racemase family protein [Clostridia bacterium]|nr:aspartate/glutamate racemase family protein [Clostridia bacterium]